MSLDARALRLAAGGRTLFDGLSLSVAPGDVWAVIGPNGSGKTTLLHALAGLREPGHGEVTVDGAPAGDARAAGLLLQSEPVAFWGTAFDYALLGRFPRARSAFAWYREDETAARGALDEVGLGALGDRLFASLSGGERQRARIAQLIAQSPRYFLLDEPLQNLDLRHQAAVLDWFARAAASGGHGVVMVLHDTLWPGRRCTHALLLDGGGGAQAGPARAVLTRDNLERAYGCRLRAVPDGDSEVIVPDV